MVEVRDYLRRNGGILTSSREEFVRWQLPYGCYHCADEREVLFDRDYAPLCERRPGEAPKLANPCEWINFEWQENFYDDGTPRREKLAIGKTKLEEWGMLQVVLDAINEAICGSEPLPFARRLKPKPNQ